MRGLTLFAPALAAASVLSEARELNGHENGGPLAGELTLAFLVLYSNIAFKITLLP